MNKPLYFVVSIVLLLFLLAYNSNFIMFKLVTFVDDKLDGRINLIDARNNLMHTIDDLNPLKGTVWGSKDQLPIINLSLKKKDLRHIEQIVEKAEDNSPYAFYMPNEVNEFIKAKIRIEGKKYKSEVKIHGTNNPHFRNEKKSYSIKIRKKKNKEYPFNVRRFALVIPSQSNLIGLFTYKVADMLGMVTPKNFLVRLHINGIDQGVYHLEEKLNKTLLERNGMSGYDIVRSDDSWAHQYANNHGTIFSFDYSGISPKYTSGKDLNQMTIFKKILNTDDIAYIKQHINIEKFISYDILRYIFGDSGHMTSNDNIKLLYNTATAKIEPYFRIENHIEKIIENKLTYSPEQHVNIGMFTTNSLLFNLTKDDDYREKRNKSIYRALESKNTIIKMFDEIMSGKLHILVNDTTNEVPSRYFEFEAAEARKALIHNFDFLQKYLEYSRVFVELVKKDKDTHSIIIMPDSNAPISVKDFKIYVDRSYVGNIVRIENIDNGVVYDIDVVSHKDKGVINLNAVFEDSTFSLSLDDSLEPKKRIYKYNLKFNGEIQKSSISFYNDLSNKPILDRDLYSVIVDESTYVDSKLPPFVFKVDKNTYQVKQGEHILVEDVVFPYGVNLVINEGTIIRLKKGASVLINGGLSINGRKENPVRIINSSANDIFGSIGVVGNGKTKVNINFLEIYGGSEDVINGIHLSGALSLYNHAFISIENSDVHHNSADDGVNIKNANFLVKNNKFHANKADQIDIDFGKGSVLDNNFSQPPLIKGFNNVKVQKDDNGDGLDLSGSKILIMGNVFEGFLDKGMSVGENTKVFVSNNIFKGNRSAITSKDQSQVYIKGNVFLNNQIDVEMYQKKKFFKHPSVFDLNKGVNHLKIRKTSDSSYFKTTHTIQNKINEFDASIFSILENVPWVAYE